MIDTPGLDDSNGLDAENIAALAECLGALAHTEYPKVSALLLVCDANAAFSDSFQRTYKYYQNAMPNLFGGLAVLNTKFTVATWAEKRGFQLPQESAKEREMNERRSAFSKIFNRNPHHFFIDNVPNPGRLFEELVTLNTIAEIFNFIGGRGSMEIGQMLFPKTDKMIVVDAKAKYLLTGVKAQLETNSRRVRVVDSRIAACERLLKLLSNPCPPLTEGFDDAARKRYTKTADDVNFDDIIAMARIHEPGLVSYLAGMGGKF